MKRFKENKYFSFGTMLLMVIVVGLVLLAVVLNLGAIGGILQAIRKALSPLFIGAVLAYLLNPLMNFFSSRLYPLFAKGKNQEKAKKRCHAISLLLAVLMAFVLFYEFCALLLPQLYESIAGIVNNFSAYYAKVEGWLMNFLADNPTLQAYAEDAITKGYNFLENWATDGLLPGLETVVAGVTSSVFSVVGGVINALIGICAAIYMLSSRDMFLAQAKKLVVALWKEEKADRILDVGRRIHVIFSGFVIGTLLDSLIIGLLCYIGMLIMGLQYPALIATVVGVTNVIPFFGPFIGALPSMFLILLVEPVQALYFGIFILVLQQMDGNVIKPRILGDTIGISGFWVLFSITVAGSLFGFAGMVLGVPVFAVIYMLINDFIANRLKAKGMTLRTKVYQTIQKVEDLNDPELKD